MTGNTRIKSIGQAVNEALNGNNEGFTYLYEQTYRKSYYTAYKYMKNEEAAADVVQEAYTRAFQNLTMLQEHDKFSGWLSMIVANTAKNELRKKNPVLFSEMDIDNGEDNTIEFEDTIVDEKTDFRPEEHYSKVEMSELVDELLNALPEEQKICLILYYLEGLSVEEIAVSLECSKNTVTSRLNYGRKKIRSKGEELEKRGYKLYSVSPVVLLALLLRTEINSYAAMVGATASGNAVSNTKVGSTLEKAAGKSSTAKAGFLSTTAGKVVAAFAGVAIVGGITAGIILASSGKDKKNNDATDNIASNNITSEVVIDLTTEDVTEVTSEKQTETPDDITTEITTDTTQVEVEKDDAEVLLSYLETKLIPEYGIYDPSQLYIEFGPDASATVYTFEYNKDTEQLIRMETDVYDYDSLIANYDYDYSGIYYANIDDYDNDSHPELLVIRGTGLQKVESTGTENNVYIAELYDVKKSKASKIAETPLYFSESGINGNENYSISSLFIETIDDQQYLLCTYWKPHSDVSQNDYVMLVSLEDLSFVSYLYGTMIQGPNEIYSLYKDYDLAGGEVKEYTAGYREENGKWVGDPGFGYASAEYLESLGYMNDTTEEIFHICMLTDIAREYLFGENSQNGQNTTENGGNGQENTVDGEKGDSNKIPDEVLGYILGYRSTRYGAKFIQLSEDGTFTISYTDHEPYAGDVEGEATGIYSDIQKIDEYTYSFKVSDMKDLYVAHTEEVEVQDPNIEGGSYIYRHEFVELADEAEGEYIIYLPGTSRSSIPENVEIGASGAYPTEGIVDKSTNEITDFAIYKKGANFAYFIDR